MLCNCCYRDVNKTCKSLDLKNTFARLFTIETDDFELCSWCYKTIRNVDTFRTQVLEAQIYFSETHCSNFMPNEVYNLRPKTYIDYYNKSLVEEKIFVKTEHLEDERSSNDSDEETKKQNSLKQELGDEFGEYEEEDDRDSDESSQNVTFEISTVGNHLSIQSLYPRNQSTSASSTSHSKKHKKSKNDHLLINLHSYSILKRQMKKVRLSKKYDILLQTEEEILNEIKTKDEELQSEEIKCKCLLCHQAFKDEEHQNVHASLHQYRPNTVLCKFCNVWIDDDRGRVVSHYRTHYIRYKCKECDMVFNNVKQLTLHYDRKHTKHECQHCGKVFNSRTTREYHLDKTHRGKTFDCETCGKSYKTRPNLKAHLELHDGKTYSCDVCGKLLKSMAQYWCHKNIEHSAPHTCDVCNKIFKNKSAYNKHLRETLNHQIERRKFKCSYCDNEYLGENQMKLHMNVVHFGVGINCYICGKLCQSKSKLTRHMESHADKSGRTRDHICDHCGKAFYTKMLLKEHMNVHSDERPYKCKFCNATFKFKSAMYTHISLVHKKEKKNRGVKLVN